MRGWSERRRAWWRWGWVALVAGILFCPVGTTVTCTHSDTDGQCSSQPTTLVGLKIGIAY